MLLKYIKSKISTGIVATILLVLVACEKKPQEILITPDNFYQATDKITEVMVHDIFSPPVAARIYAYPGIAAYEVMAMGNDNYQTLAGQLTDLDAIPELEIKEKVNFKLAALVAYLEVSKQLVFSEDKVMNYRDSLYQSWENSDSETFSVSKNYGLQVAEHVKEWMNSDHYHETRTMPKFSVFIEDAARWQPTPPDYMDGIEPHWGKIRPFVIDSAAQFKPAKHPDFSLKKDSDFYKELLEVYETGKKIRAIGNDSEEIQIAQFWDCNPYVSTHKGHLMFAKKKITPGAHWIGIGKIAAKKANADFDRVIYAYTKTAIAINDAFISCWDEKYRSNLIRPETLINQHLDENWMPVLQTPPFPEYTSGHSVVSGAASTALTDVFGDNFEFDDTTEVPYGLPVRSFSSFNKAADEAAVSRLYGGIHYRAAIDIGLKQGRELGKFVIDNLKMEKRNIQ
ncbi:MAG: phosphatidic acid phosphatase [Flavobacteriales bacterium]|nr:MAG: phosphatidic acid phosphatase [Flavobacteriales bacterium]